MSLQYWFLPAALLVAAIGISIPLSKYLVWIMEGRYHPPRILAWFEKRISSGPQDWKQYCVAFMLFNILIFVFGFAVLSLQPYLGLLRLRSGQAWPCRRGLEARATVQNTCN